MKLDESLIYRLKRETTITLDVVNDKVYECLTSNVYFISDPIKGTYTLKFTIDGEENVYVGCKIQVSPDQNRIEWHNADTNGVIELK